MFGQLIHQASHGLGTTDEEDEAVQVARAVHVNTAARTLALGIALNSSWPRVTVTSMATEMAKLVNRFDSDMKIEMELGWAPAAG